MKSVFNYTIVFAASLLIACRAQTNVLSTGTPERESSVASATTLTSTATDVPTATPEPFLVATPEGESVVIEVTPMDVSVEYPSPSNVTLVWPEGAAPSAAIARIGLGSVTHLAVSPTDDYLVLGTTAGIYLFDAGTMRQIWRVAVKAPVNEVLWSPDGAYLAVRLENDSVLLWETFTTPVLYRLEIEAKTMGWSPNQHTLVTASVPEGGKDAGTDLTFWDANTREPVRLIALDETLPFGRASAFDVTYAPDGNTLALITGRETVTLLELDVGSTRALNMDFARGHTALQALAFDPSGTRLVGYTGISGPSDAPGGDPMIYIWDIETGSLMVSPDYADITDKADWGIYPVTGLDWSPDGNLLALASSWTGPVAVWDTRQMETEFVAPSVLTESVAWSPDGHYLLTAYNQKQPNRDWQYVADGGITLFDTRTYSVVSQFAHRDFSWNNATALDWLADSQRFVALVNSDVLAGSVDVNASHYLLNDAPSVSELRWSPDSKRLATLPDTSLSPYVTIWDVVNGTLDNVEDNASSVSDWLAPAENHTLSDSLEPELFTSFDGRYRLKWESQRTEELAPEGYLTDRQDELIIITALDSGNQQTYHETRVAVASVAFSPDNRYVAVGFGPHRVGILLPRLSDIHQNHVAVYDLESGQRITLYGHAGRVTGLAWSPDSNYLTSISADGTILIWPIQP